MSKPPGPGPVAGFIFFVRLKKTNQKKGLPAGSFFLVRLIVFLLNRTVEEFALRQTQRVCVSVAVGLLFWRRGNTSPLKVNRVLSYKI